MSKKYLILAFLVFILINAVNAQNKIVDIWEKDTLRGFADVGISYKDYMAFNIDYAYGNKVALGGGSTITFSDTNAYSFETFLRIPYRRSYRLYADLCFIYHTNFSYGSFGIKPQIAFDIDGPFTLSYGYNFLFSNQDFIAINKHNFSIRFSMVYPIKKSKK
jgi:hypothetical protein